MSATTQAKWDTPAYRHIASARSQGDKLIVLFEDRSWVQLTREQVIRPDTQGVRWKKLTWTPFEVIVPTMGDRVVIPWSTIRALTDKDYSAHLAAAAEEEAQQMGARLRELRETRGMTGKELAERVGIAPQNLSHIECGRHDIALSTLRRLLAAMGYSFADLTDGTGA